MLVHVFACICVSLYIAYRRAFDVACFDNSGNAKTSIRGTSDSLGSTFFLYLYYGEKYKMIAREFESPRQRVTLSFMCIDSP